MPDVRETFDKSAIANLDGIKREFALAAAALLPARLGGGDRFVRRLPSRAGGPISRDVPAA